MNRSMGDFRFQFAMRQGGVTALEVATRAVSAWIAAFRNEAQGSQHEQDGSLLPDPQVTPWDDAGAKSG